MEHASFSRCRRGEHFCGDGVGVYGTDALRLFAVVDGLGHGPGASDASQRALGFIEQHWQEDLEAIVRGCDEALRDTRGAALFICRIAPGSPEGRIECTGVGNVDIKTIGPSRISGFSRDGIVGRFVRKVSVLTSPCVSGDMLAIYSDGVRARFDLGAYAGLSCEAAAKAVLDRFASEEDDATILVVKV